VAKAPGLQQHEPAFRDNEVDGDVLADLTAEDLIGLGVTLIGHRRKLLSAIAALTAEAPAAPLLAGPMPSRLVEQHDGMRSRCDAGGGRVEMELHGLAVASRHHNSRALPQRRTYRAEQIGRLRSLIMRGPWARPFLAQR
jgi:hypothetical protein